LDAWQNLVTAEGHFQPHRHGGYRPVAADTIGFFRPRLHGCPTQHFAPPAGKALPAIRLGVVVSVGSVNQQRLPLPRALVRADARQPTEAHLPTRLLQTVNTLLESDEALVSDRGVSLAAVQAAGVTRYVCRVRKNFTARRADPPTPGENDCRQRAGSGADRDGWAGVPPRRIL
jgi:hypothetical protein